MEYISHGDLRHYMEVERSESEAKVITRQLLEGLLVIHEKGFAHRDLKPEVRPPLPSSWCKRPTDKEVEYLCSRAISHMGQNWGRWAGGTGEGPGGFSYPGELRRSRNGSRY